jgi:acetate kinase
MKAIVVNCGSSSIKYQIFDVSGLSVLAHGLLERIGESKSHLNHQWQNAAGKSGTVDDTRRVPDHMAAFDWIGEVNSELGTVRDERELFGIGHRVVHGGEVFHEPALIDEEVVDAIRRMIPLAPLHNPANLTGIEVALERFPHVPQVAVFDTAFHHSMPPHAFHYALPYDLYRVHNVRRYGFHGTSHHFVAKQAALHMGRPLGDLNLITLHLGNGASATAIKGGKSVDTSMGMTPLEGLMMGTRCGDLDPAIHFYLSGATGKSNVEIEKLLNRECGLKGICGQNDMREVESMAEGGDERAGLAVEMFSYRIRKYIGAYFAVLGRVDAIVFTGGIGENSPVIRKGSLDGLTNLGIVIDDRKNDEAIRGQFEIHDSQSTVKILVIPTNEELEIARQTVDRIRSEQL